MSLPTSSSVQVLGVATFVVLFESCMPAAQERPVIVTGAQGLELSGVYELEPTTGARTLLIPGNANFAELSHDGRSIAYVRPAPPALMIYEVGEGRSRVLSEFPDAIVAFPDWSSDDASILVSAGPFPNVDVFRVDVESGNSEMVLGGPGGRMLAQCGTPTRIGSLYLSTPMASVGCCESIWRPGSV